MLAAHYGDRRGRLKPLDFGPCARPKGKLINGDGEFLVAPCGRNSCLACFGMAARRLGEAIPLSRPNLFIRLSLVGDSWPVIRTRMTRLREALRDAGFAYEWSWVVHRNPGGTGHHAHVHWRGDIITQAELADRTGRLGLGFPRVDEVYARNSGLGFYVWKHIEDEAALRQHLNMNGGRLEHHSRRFFVGPDGEPVTVRRMLRPPRDGGAVWRFIPD